MKTRIKKLKVGDIAIIEGNKLEGNKDDKRKVEILHICPNYFSHRLAEYCPLYKIRFLSGIVGQSKVEETWWIDENDLIKL